VNKYRQEHAYDEPPLEVSERARLRELEREMREVRMENEFLKKSRCVLRPESPVSEKFEFIDRLKYAYPVVKMCQWLSVSRSGFYEWRGRPASATAERREDLKARIVKIFDEEEQTYGYRRVHAELARQGVPAGPELVRASIARSGAGGVPATSLAATVLDCHTKAVVGYAMGDHYKTPLISTAIDVAVRNDPLVGDGTIFHSDRGSNYTSYEFGQKLASLG
jgi:putative transposase